MKSINTFNLDKNNEICILGEFKNIKFFKKNNTNLVHYSLTSRGNALYYQKIIITKIFRMVSLSLHSYSENFNTNIRFLSLGGRFQQKYCLLSNIHQIKRCVSNIIWNTNFDSYGSFKNFFYKSSNFGSDFFLKKYREAKKSTVFINRKLDYMFHINTSTEYAFINKIRSANTVNLMKSNFFNLIWDDIVLFSKSIVYDKIKENIIYLLTSLNIFIRTIWFRLVTDLNNFKQPIDFISNEGFYRRKLIKTQRFSWIFSGDFKNLFFTTLSNWSKREMDIAKELKINARGGIYKRNVKRYPRWRLGIVHWGKKILRFKKNYLFWKYMRGLSIYFYRGFYAYSVFNNRIDVFILKTFGVKSLKFARLLISSGHIFMGSFAIKNPKTRVQKYNLITISKKANIFINKKKYFKYWRNNINYFTKKIQTRLIKTSPLIFCRQHKANIFWGEIKNTKYSLFFGSNLDMINVDNKKTKYFALNYFYIQKSISSAWW